MSAGGPWLSVVGIGDAGLASLSVPAQAVVAAGEVLVGGERHLAMVPDHAGERLPWRRPLEATLDDLAALRGRRVVVLASGDPMCFGVGRLLVQRFDLNEIRILPAPSAFSLVCARLGWSLPDVACLTAHNRPLATLRRHLAPGAKLIVLSHDGATPGQIAELLRDEGFGPSRLWVLEHLGGRNERSSAGAAAGWGHDVVAALNTVAVEVVAGPGAAIRSNAPGLPDDAFESDGLLTKREVRAATLARLMPLPGQCLWDVGAGSGAIAIEWLRAGGGRAVAIEREAQRCAVIARNAEQLGTPELDVIHGDAPGCLTDLPGPDAAFIGGGIDQPDTVETCWQALPSGGRLVANVVTVEGERRLLDWRASHGGELTRIGIARLEPLGRYHGWRPALPVTQLAALKP